MVDWFDPALLARIGVRDIISGTIGQYADQRLMQANIPSLRHIRREGGRILLIAVPPLRTPDDLASEVAERVRTLFGNSTAIKGRQP